MIEISILVAVLMLAIAAATFFLGRTTAARASGREEGGLSKDISYIRDAVTKMEGKLDSATSRLEGRIDELSKQQSSGVALATRALENAKSAQKRMDEHLEREHHILTHE